MPLRLVSWNVGRRREAWRLLAQDSSLDLALLQEARPPADGLAREVVPKRSERWTTTGYPPKKFRTAIARFSDRITLRPWREGAIGDWHDEVLPVSRGGTLTAADVLLDGKHIVTVASAYGFWEAPLSKTRSKWSYADASAHRLLSDVAALIGSERGHKLIVAGDFNILYGHGERGSAYWKARYESVFARALAMGLVFAGPQHPHGRQPSDWPAELPRTSKNVVTFRSRPSPESAMRQLDFVLASAVLERRLHVRALNGVDEWGPSDHCQVQIELAVPGL